MTPLKSCTCLVHIGTVVLLTPFLPPFRKRTLIIYSHLPRLWVCPTSLAPLDFLHSAASDEFTKPLVPYSDNPQSPSTQDENVNGRVNGVQDERPAPVERKSTQKHRQPFTLKRAATTLFHPDRKVGDAPGLLRSLRSIILSSYVNLLLVFIPISWAFHFAMPNSNTLIFVFSFLAIIPLAKLLAFATDELSMRVGQTLAGLLNATLGNAVELIVAIIALTQCKLQLVQSSLVGSILSNLLLVLGMCFFAGGVRFSEQGFGAVATQLNSSLLTISVIAVLLPAAFHLNVNSTTDSDEQQDILKMSHGVCLIFSYFYGSYLFFQLYSHATLYEDHHENNFKSTRYAPRKKDAKKDDDITQPAPVTSDPEQGSKEDEEGEVPLTSLPVCLILLVGVTVLVAVTAEFLVDSIDGLVESSPISEEFVGVILLPIVGNAAEHVTAVTVSMKDKLTLSLGVAVGSSIQIALFVIPFIVTLGWILGKPLTLLFDPYESITLFLAVLTVNYCVQDGKSNWLEGMILMCLYIILGVTFWFYPGSNPSGLTC
ncbi:calcium/proton exchanger [Dendrothele bispora CBS 962.96]|uniref:Vacuolar calcium ion transporter n=1 Tax=Dendrothele bispora (strain CBS 962.96) TaxID=1314807 RepID=A0A4S8MK69_DENBC|nr:calcium/proton exchanger [Dendrothele bispora CBS 962.96]